MEELFLGNKIGNDPFKKSNTVVWSIINDSQIGFYLAFKIRPIVSYLANSTFMIPSSFLLINYDIIKFLVFLLIHEIVRVWLTTTTILDVRGKVGFFPSSTQKLV